MKSQYCSINFLVCDKGEVEPSFCNNWHLFYRSRDFGNLQTLDLLRTRTSINRCCNSTHALLWSSVTCEKSIIYVEFGCRKQSLHSLIQCVILKISCLCQVESTQSMIRIVGLSATLPNYLEVGTWHLVHLSFFVCTCDIHEYCL